MDQLLQDVHFELQRNLGQFDVVKLQLENVVENMDGDVEIQLLGGCQENRTPRCRGLGVPANEYIFSVLFYHCHYNLFSYCIWFALSLIS